MTGDALLQRLETQENDVRSRLDELRGEVTHLEEQLAHLAITRRTVTELLADVQPAPGPTDEDVRPMQAAEQLDDGHRTPEDAEVGTDSARLGVVPPQDRKSSGSGTTKGRTRVLGPVSAKICVLVSSADRPLTAKDVTLALGRNVEKRTRVESVRAALEKLVANGYLIKVGPGLFRGRHEQREGAA